MWKVFSAMTNETFCHLFPTYVNGELGKYFEMIDMYV